MVSLVMMLVSVIKIHVTQVLNVRMQEAVFLLIVTVVMMLIDSHLMTSICSDIYERSSNYACSKYAVCMNTLGSYTCHCNAGLEAVSI